MNFPNPDHFQNNEQPQQPQQSHMMPPLQMQQPHNPYGSNNVGGSFKQKSSKLPWIIGGVCLFMFLVVAGGCAAIVLFVDVDGDASTEVVSTTSISTRSAETTSDTKTTTSSEWGSGSETQLGADTANEAMDASCFELDDEFKIPDTHLFASDINSGTTCDFVIHRIQAADRTVIAGEVFESSSNKTFEETKQQILDSLEVGQEADLLPLRLINSSASGNNLEVLDTTDYTNPNAVMYAHASDRRFAVAFTAVIEIPVEAGENSRYMIIWAIGTDVNLELLPEFIENIEFK